MDTNIRKKTRTGAKTAQVPGTVSNADARDVLLREVSEAEFQQAILEYAHLRGWLCHAQRPARSDKGWRTPIQGDPGYFDVTCAKEGRVVFLELKKQGGTATPAQLAWIKAAWRYAYLVMPSDWPLIEEVLSA